MTLSISSLLELPWIVTPAEIGIDTLIASVLSLLIGAASMFILVRYLIGQTLAGAKAEAEKLLERAESEAKTHAEKIRVDAERDALNRKASADKEIDHTRSELRDAERRLAKREDVLTSREGSIVEKERHLDKTTERLRLRESDLDTREAEIGKLVETQSRKLEEISGYSKDQALDELLVRVEDERRHAVAKRAREIEEEAELKSRERATEITLNAIQRYAAELTSESTVRSVEIPSDEMKGRIIGREGRNIRAFEKATGADIIVDDTPGVIIVSCFDKVRQQVAVESLEKLIADGRMHPSRIEEIVAKTRSELDERVRKFGKDAALEVNLKGLNPKIAEAMGKLHYRTSYGQNVLKHSIEVAYFCQIIAEQLGLDGRLARRCGFLHDIGKAMDHEMEGGHPKIGMDFAKQYGEKEPVLNAIGGHHADIPSTSFYTPIVMAADAVSSSRPGARRESMERYIQRLNELQDIAMRHKGVVEAHAIQAGREVRVMRDAGRVSDAAAQLNARKIADAVSEEMTFPGEVKVTVLRETRAVEIAR